MSAGLEFLVYLGEQPTDRQTLIEASGLDEKTVGNRLQYLRTKGLAKRVDGGWVRIDGGTAEPPKEREARDPPKQEQEIGDRMFAFFIDEDGDIQLCEGDADPVIVPRADALRLAAFLERVRPLLTP